ncbi:MAG: DUF4120 family protein [Candidatus Riflebacteria bacterium]|nr:DUF4120 family protein [Candidatus Riflebacteria bacterium]
MDNENLGISPLIEFDKGNDTLIERVKQALSHLLSQSFQDCPDTLVRLANNVNGKARLWLDFAPLSFTFVIIRETGGAWINGGLIFHGSHDGYGSGSAPTHAVCVSPEEGLTIHT